jgi:integrase/recombinase XerD
MAELPTLVEAVETSLAPHLAVPSLPFDADLLAGQLADSSIAMYRRDFTAYVGYAASQALDPLQPATLARWRTTLAKDTQLSPNTINRMLSAVKRLMAQAAEQGYLDHEVAETFQDLKGVKRGALKTRLKADARIFIAPEDMRRLQQKPDVSTLRGLRDVALLATLASSGLRVSEVSSLTCKQIVRQGEEYVLLVRGKMRRTTAGHCFRGRPGS